MDNQKSALEAYGYVWPSEPLNPAQWREIDGFLSRDLPESNDELAHDSRWPAFFPSPMCIVTTSDGDVVALEKVVGPSIVNRFPYIAALSFCRTHLSSRHHPRSRFMDVLETGKAVAIQFLPPGSALTKIMHTIAQGDEALTAERLTLTGLPTRKAKTNDAPVFEDAYLVYEGRLASPSVDIEGVAILSRPWRDVGSHRVYFVEIEAIALKEEIARGERQIYWRSLPTWQPTRSEGFAEATDGERRQFIKGYNPQYRFPSAETIPFFAEQFEHGMGLMFPRRRATEDLRRLSNDDARWPCFFPSSLGMITTLAGDGTPTVLPCGSTTIVSRHPLVVAVCISYARINERYAPRASLEMIQSSKVFGCGVPYMDQRVVDAITYSGNVSFADDPQKVRHSGLDVHEGGIAPLLPALPVTFECRLVGEERLGTHVMFLGEVRRISVRSDVTINNPLRWFPWSDVVAINAN